MTVHGISRTLFCLQTHTFPHSDVRMDSFLARLIIGHPGPLSLARSSSVVVYPEMRSDNSNCRHDRCEMSNSSIHMIIIHLIPFIPRRECISCHKVVDKCSQGIPPSPCRCFVCVCVGISPLSKNSFSHFLSIDQDFLSIDQPTNTLDILSIITLCIHDV